MEKLRFTPDICDECGSRKLHIDYKMHEVACMSCGLVLTGPPSYSGYIKIVYPWGSLL